MSDRSPEQQQAWDRSRASHMMRAQTEFEHRCDHCDVTFQGTRAEARELGWRKKWRRKKAGLRVQIDLCPDNRRGSCSAYY